MLKTAAAGLALALLAAAPALAQAELSPTDIVNRHMAFAAAGDVDGIVGDYADDGVAITPGGATQGKAALKTMFTGMVGGGAGGAPKPAFKTIKIWQQGDVGFVAWQLNAGSPNVVNGTDSFLVKHGKIVAQAVFIGAPPPKP